MQLVVMGFCEHRFVGRNPIDGSLA